MSTEQKKPWWQSVTVLSGVMQLLSGLGMSGLNINFVTGDFDGNIYVLWASVTPLLTGTLTIYGRLKATQRLK